MRIPHDRCGGAGKEEAQIDLNLDDEGWIIAKSAGGVTQFIDDGRKSPLFRLARSRAETRMSATGPVAVAVLVRSGTRWVSGIGEETAVSIS